MEPLIRKMRAEDMEAALAVLAAWNMAPIAPSPELPDPERSRLDVAHAFVAELDGRLVGVASYIVVSAAEAETASLAVDPAVRGRGIGRRLQEARLREMARRGIRRVRTEADRPETIAWYVRHFGYHQTGTNPKKHAFGDPSVAEWTVLELELKPDAGS